MERAVHGAAAPPFEQANISLYKQPLKENECEISTVLHTDFVSNFCLISEQQVG